MINDNWCLILYLAGNCWNDSDTEAWCTGELFNTKLLTEKKAWREVVDMAAENGIDSLYINLANGIRYASHPEIAIEGAWEVEELKEELMTAGIVSPEVNWEEDLSGEQVYETIKLKEQVEIGTLYLIQDEE
jgi:hypothetical protein